PNDAASWAHLIRMATKMPLRAPRDQPKIKLSGVYLARKERYLALISERIANGERLDPDNVYFTILKSTRLESIKRHTKTQLALREASKKSNYEDYTLQETNVVYRAALNECGYRDSAM